MTQKRPSTATKKHPSGTPAATPDRPDPTSRHGTSQPVEPSRAKSTRASVSRAPATPQEALPNTAVPNVPATGPTVPEFTSTPRTGRTRRPNPNRRTFSEKTYADRGTGQQRDEYQAHQHRTISQEILEHRGTEGTRSRQQCTITIVGVKNRYENETTSLGLCIRDYHNMRFMTYPARERLDDVLPHAFETAVLNAPALSDIILTTPYKQLWTPGSYTEKTREFLNRNNCRLTHAYPLPHDLGGTLARLAANGTTGPLRVEYHLYTAAITDEHNAYVAGLLWGKNYAHRYIQTIPRPQIAIAEAAAVEWAFKLMPQNAHVLMHNANATLGRIWQNPREIEKHPDIREAMRGVGKQMRAKEIKFFVDTEPHHNVLARVVREIVGGLYANVDPRRQR